MHSDEGFQIATLVVIVVIVLLCMSMLLVFVNPQVALNPLKPPIPTATFIALELPATWTPTFTATPTQTPSPTSTYTPTSTPTPTNTITNTPSPTPTRTRRPVTPTPRPPTPSPWTYDVVPGGCAHSGGTYIEGHTEVYGIGEEASVRVSLGTSPGGNVVQTITTGSGRSPGYFVFVINANGSTPGTWYVWIIDGVGRTISDPNAGRVTTNSITNADDPNSCWLASFTFARH